MNKPYPQQDLFNKIDSLQNSLANKTKEIELLKAQVGNANTQKNKEEVLSDSAIYKHILNSITEAIYILNSKWEFIEVNRGAELMYGYSREELIGKTPLDVSAPNKNDIPKVIADLEYVLKNGGTRSFGFWGQRKNKEIFFKEVIINKGCANKQDVLIASARDVTDMKRSEEDRDRIFNFSIDMICTAGLDDGYLKQVNPAWRKTLGWTPKELRSKPFIDFIHPDDLAHTLKAAADIGVGKPALGFKNRYQAKDGSYRWLSWNTIPIPEENLMMGIARDITEQKIAEEKVQQSEEKFRALYNNAPLSYQSLDNDGRFMDINPTWCSTLGYEREEVIGHKYTDFLHPEWKPHFEKNFPAFKERGYVKDVQFKLKHKKGHFIDVSYEGCIGYHPDGSFRQTYCVFKDITIEKQAQEALHESETKFKGLFLHANAGIAIANSNADIVEANEAYLELLGYSKDELLKLSFRDFTHPDDLALEIKLVEQLYSGEIENYRIEKRFITKKGEIVWGDAAIAVLKTADGEIDMFIGMVMDITKNKKIEIELRKAKERAEEADHLKSAFLANMSHEIRTPMNGILGFADLLELPNLTKEQQQQYLSIIKRSGGRMLSTVNDIIDISKIDAGQTVVDLSVVNLKNEIDSLYLFFKPEAQKKGLELTLRNECASLDDMRLLTDQGKFVSILTNLIKNAIKYTDEGEIEIGVKISNSTLNCWVKDTGIGIPDDRKKAVFNRFEQADIADVSAREGSGLGLAIAKSYAELLNGELFLESELGQGSTFYFNLPWKPVKMTNKRVAETHGEEFAEKAKQLNILIAEDDDISFQHLQIIVGKVAGTITRARNGKETVELAQKTKDIQCILLDVKMPVMDGYQACRKIREFNKEVVIIAQTAYALEGEREKALKAGCNHYIAKPIKKDILLQIIQTIEV